MFLAVEVGEGVVPDVCFLHRNRVREAPTERGDAFSVVVADNTYATPL